MTGTAKTASAFHSPNGGQEWKRCLYRSGKAVFPKDSDMRWIHTIKVSSLAAMSTVSSEQEMQIHPFSLSWMVMHEEKQRL